ncbi:MAG: PIN domain-containing protein [Propionibacteriaceae bacterium]|jgi:predicted nucleic acid-binding protein|nr:PIN domain-containing protein [Propionibacteriaceae bacterium]
MAERVLLDACVLVPISLCDVLLDLADAGLFDPAWSEAILDETRRALTDKRGLAPERADRRIAQMTSAFPHAEVTGFERLIGRMANHPKDRHVLAAAVQGRCRTVVTANLSDFPLAALAPHGVDAAHPDEFLTGLWRRSQDQTLTALRRKVALFKNPPMTLTGFAGVLEPLVPGFADLLAAADEQPGEAVSASGASV